MKMSMRSRMSRFLAGVCVCALAAVPPASAEQKWAEVNTAAASSDSSPSTGNAGRYTAYLCTVEAAEQMFGGSSVGEVSAYLADNYEAGKAALGTLGFPTGSSVNAGRYALGQYTFTEYFPSVLLTSQYLSVLFYDNGDDSEFRVFGSDNAQRESTTWITFNDEESGTVSDWTKPKLPIVATVTGASGTAGEGPFSCTLTVTDPASGSVALWYDENGEVFGATAPTYNTAGVYTNVVKVTAADYRDFIGTGVVTVAAAPLPPIEAHYAAIITEEANGDTSPSLPSAKDYSAYLCTKEAAEQMFGSSDVDVIAAYLAGNYEAGKAALGTSGTLLDASEYSWGQYTFVKYFPSALAFSEYLGILFYDNADGSEFRIFDSDNATLIDDSVVFDDENTSGTVSEWTEPTPPEPPSGGIVIGIE